MCRQFIERGPSNRNTGLILATLASIVSNALGDNKLAPKDFAIWLQQTSKEPTKPTPDYGVITPDMLADYQRGLKNGKE